MYLCQAGSYSWMQARRGSYSVESDDAVTDFVSHLMIDMFQVNLI